MFEIQNNDIKRKLRGWGCYICGVEIAIQKITKKHAYLKCPKCGKKTRLSRETIKLIKEG